MKTIFGNNLRALREEKNLTQRDLAEKIGTTHTTIANYENGGKYPQRDEIKSSLLEVLSCSEVDLYGYSDGYYSRKFFANYDNNNKSHTEIKNGVAINNCLKSKNDEQIEVCLVDLKNNKFYKVNKVKRAIDKNIVDKYPNGQFIKVLDDSMNRYLPANSYAYVVDNQNNDYENNVCALTLDGFNIIFRRISFLSFDKLVALVPQSTNDKYKSETVNKQNYPEFKIFGKVVWFSNDAEDL